MNPLLFLGPFLLVVSLSAPLVAGSFDRGASKKEDPRTASEQEEQGRSLSGCLDWDDLRQDPRQATADSSIAVTAVDESVISTPQSASVTERDKVFALLGDAFRQAYARRDEYHADWNKVDELIKQLFPKDIEEHIKKRFSINSSEASRAAVDELEYAFFTVTLPAVRKGSVTAGLRRPDHFQTTSIIGKAEEEQQAWQKAKKEFEEYCEERKLGPMDSAETSMLQEDEQGYNDYIQKFDYHIARCSIESQLNGLHHDIMQNIIQANVTTADFETRTFPADTIISHYQPLLALISEEKKFAPPAEQRKWEQFEQEAAALVLNDSTQVERIKLWKNRNHVNAIHKEAERLQEQAERAARAATLEIGTAFLKSVTTQVQAALTAWEQRKIQLEALQGKIEIQKKSLPSLNITSFSSLVEKEIQEALQEAEQKRAHWNSIPPPTSSMQETDLSNALTRREQQPNSGNTFFWWLRNCFEASDDE